MNNNARVTPLGIKYIPFQLCKAKWEACGGEIEKKKKKKRVSYCDRVILHESKHYRVLLWELNSVFFPHTFPVPPIRTHGL